MYWGDLDIFYSVRIEHGFCNTRVYKMVDKGTLSNEIVEKVITIGATPAKVWEALTNTTLMKQWMAEEEITIITDWNVGSPITIKGDSHWVYFENMGTVLEYEPERVLKYSHLSSLSRLRDEPENYTILEFRLSPMDNQTTLILALNGFATEAIYKHLVYYWTVTFGLLKEFIEKQK